MPIIKCYICGKPKERTKGYLKKIKHPCCSSACYYKRPRTWVKKGRPGLKGKDNPCWKGGKVLRDGYIALSTPDHPYKSCGGYVLKHRLIMEKHLGRYLLPTEIVHHKNNKKLDNRFKNLMLCSHANHTALHPRKRNHLGQYI